MKNHGTASFPDEARRKEEENYSFEKRPTISILVPLYNTPLNFLEDMIHSVEYQTYSGWELCLADGSDDAHSYVGEYCRKKADADKRIVYKKLEKNEGISSSTFKPTVRPPRLGGNVRMGVFATRSPFRPNPIGLSSVEISRIELNTEDGPIIYIKGADLMNGTPILDIKPYLPFTDSHPEARGGFTDQTKEQEPLEVVIPDEILSALSRKLDEKKIVALRQVLSQDPRPHYQEDEERVYGLNFAGEEIHFRVKGKVLTVE